MKHKFIYTILGFLFFIPTLVHANAPAQEVIETLTLQPNESKEITVETTEKIRIGWEHTKDNADDQCKNNCIELQNPVTAQSFASMMGGSMGIEPKGGKAVAVLKNVEAIPLEITVFKKPAKK